MASTQRLDLIVGTYAGSGGRGLYPLTYAAGNWIVGEPVAAIPAASFGVYAPGLARTYLVKETREGSVAAYRGAVDGWRRVAAAQTGDAPCHLALHPSERWIAVATYQGGSVAIYALDPQSGAPRGPVAEHRAIGRGSDPRRQESAHPHWVGFDASGNTLYSVDLGLDRIFAFAFDAASGALGASRVAYAAPDGSGPRHLLFDPHRPVAFLVSEMAATLTLLRCEADGSFTAETIVSTLDGGAARDTIAGGIALNRAADCLYVTNRGEDSVAVFAIDRAGRPIALQRVPSGGRSPRFVFVLDDSSRLLVAHEGGATVTAFRITSDGRLCDPVAIPIPGAAFVMPAPQHAERR